VHLLESLSPPPTRALARAYFAAREYTKASPLYGQLWKSSGSIGDLQLYATASARAQRDAEAIGLQQKLAATMQGTPSGAKALYKQAYLLLDSQRYEEAMAAYQAWLERTAKSRGGVSENNRRAHWGIAWSAYRLGQWRKALAALDALDATLTKRDRLWRQRSLYWRGRVFAASNRPQEAMQIFADAHAVRTRGYYATLAALRAQGKTRTHHLFEAGRHAQSAVTLDVGALSTRAASLHAMGLWDEAIEEMDHTQDGVIGFAPRHRYAVEEIAARLTIDPALIFRLIWQESGNQPQVVSRVGAIGLMQLMPMTAQRQAQELGWENFRTTDLFRPVPNLRLGSWYLKKLLDRYEGALPFVLASYNAGEEAVDRWRKKRADHDFEEFIEAIPFSETRQYTQRILGTYW
jgi:soluble lytic murein transglycosylase-like protein